MQQVQTALKHLDDAITRLEAATSQVRSTLPSAEEAAVFEQKLAEFSRENGELKETVGRVAGRLDEAISRLAAALKD